MKYKDWDIPKTWESGSGPDCDGNAATMGCATFEGCTTCILYHTNVNDLLDWQKSLQPEEPEYKYKVKAKDTVFRESYKTSASDIEILTRITCDADNDESRHYFYNHMRKCLLYYRAEHEFLSSTNPNACTVGDIDDLKPCKILLDGFDYCLVWRRIKSNYDTPRKVTMRAEKSGVLEEFPRDTPCTRIPEPKIEDVEVE